MSSNSKKWGFLPACLLTLILGGMPVWQPAVATGQTIEYAIPPGPLDIALNRFAAESGVQVIYDSSLADGRTSAGASGALTQETALSAVLAGTGLSYRFTGAATVVVERIQSSEETDQGILMAPVVVTARRTEEQLQDVPASVFVLSDEDVERSNLTDFDDATLLTPNVDFAGNDNPARIFVSVRGISDLNTASTGPTIGFFQDGVLQNNTGQTINLNRRIVDADRVEVIFGPQGTAFGRGTIGGAINVVTNKPTDEFEASLRTEFGSFLDFTGEAVVNLPITDDLAVRAVAYGEFSNGFIDLPFGDTENSLGSENAGGRLSVRFTPTDRLTFDASVQFDETGVDAPAFGISESVLTGNPAVLNGTIDELNIERLNIIGEAAYDFDFGTLRSTTAFNRTTFDGIEDFDLSPPDNSTIDRDSLERAVSQELRLETKEFTLPDNFGALSSNLGFIYSDTTGSVDPIFVVNDALGTTTTLSASDTEITNIGIFGDVRWRPIERLEVAAGARFSRDRVVVDQLFSSSGPLGSFASFFAADDTFTSVTPNASILYNWTDDITTYFSFSTGFRPGGFVSSVTGDPIQFDEERVRNFEGGFRSTWFDDRLAVNASGFALFYDDIQVPISFAFGGGIENAATARSIGAEVNIGAEPIDGLSLQGGLGLSFAKFTDFTESVTGDQTGERLPRAPRTSFTFVGDYEHPAPLVRDLVPFARVEYSFRSDFSDALGSDIELGGFDVTNFRLGLRGEDLEITLFVENAFNEIYATESFAGSAVGFAPPPEFAGQSILVPGPTRRFGFVTTVRF
ncbi:MAG: TonB-dependent receptor [Pseudomonadota bacterium]